MSPIELFYSIPAVLLAVAVVVITSGITTLVDARVTPEGRRRSWVLNRVVFPTLPLITGGALAAALPLRPEALVTYTDNLVEKGAPVWGIYVVYVLWGVAVGQFSGWIFDRVKEAVRDSGVSIPGLAPKRRDRAEENPDA